MKKLIALLLTLVLAIGMLAGCSSGTPSDSGSSNNDNQSAATPAPAGDNDNQAAGDEVIKLKFGYSPPNVTEVFISAEEYLKKAIAEANATGRFDIELVSMMPTGNETNYESQVNNLENLLAQQCDAIFCSPGSEDACHNVFEEINQAGIPLILFNIAEPPAGIDGYIVGFNNETGGAVSGYAFLDYYGGPGVLGTGEMVDVEPGTRLTLEWWEDLYKDFDYSTIEDVNVGIVSGIEGSIYTVQRHDGFVNVVSQSPNVHIVAELNGDWDRTTSLAAAENILQAYDIDAFYGMCAETEMACTVAIDNANADVLVFGNDGTGETLQAIKDGKIVAETWHGFPDWGWYGVETAVKLCLGIECDKFIDIGPRTEYVDNLEVFVNPQLEPIDWEGILAQAGK